MGFNYSSSIFASSLEPNDSSFYPFSCHFPTCSSLFVVCMHCSTLASLFLYPSCKCHQWTHWYHYTFMVTTLSQALCIAQHSRSSFPFSAAVAVLYPAASIPALSLVLPPALAQSVTKSTDFTYYWNLFSLSLSRSPGTGSDHHLAWIPALTKALWSLLVCPHFVPPSVHCYTGL